jgi:hypothetical protein
MLAGGGGGFLGLVRLCVGFGGFGLVCRRARAEKKQNREEQKQGSAVFFQFHWKNPFC